MFDFSSCQFKFVWFYNGFITVTKTVNSDGVCVLMAIASTLHAEGLGFDPSLVPFLVLGSCIYHLLLSSNLNLFNYSDR